MKHCEPIKDERPIMIVCGILTLYLILIIFVDYLFLLHRINLVMTSVLVSIITIFHIKRFLIIKKLLKVNCVKIKNNHLYIDDRNIEFKNIQNFMVKELKPNIIFFLNNRMIIFNYAEFGLKTSEGEIFFHIQGSEKISLLKNFLTELISSKQ